VWHWDGYGGASADLTTALTDPAHRGAGVRFTGAMALPDPRPCDPPPLIEALAVWGWAVEHGGVPLSYAARVGLSTPGDFT
jgi:hypothetical protein